ncbi:MAG: PD40 domain-containing protein [Muribaculaceae bacterium]|nr:PD40 domain-containing protein [Muribaculaceae bacterium]
MKKSLLLFSAIMLSAGSLMAQSKANGEPRLLIKSAQSLMAPVWSPDGSKIAVTGDNFIGIWVANADGSNLNQVSEALGAGYKMNWQDAQTIVSTPYTMENGLRMVRIENVNVETAEISEVAPAQRGFRPSKVMKNVNLLRIMCDQPAEATRLIPSLEQYAGKMVLNPALSPDGKKIAFQIVSYGLFVCDVDGANLKSFGKGAYPSWAPNSRDLMFARIQDNGERFTASDLFSVNTETGVEENLTPNSDVIPITLSVSPDGSKVAFDNDVDGNIYVVDLK